MANKMSATMATQIALDTVSASKSIKSLTQLVNSATSAWKSQEVMLKSTGDYLNAAKSRYEGLGTAIERQEAKIEGLKNKQSGLNVKTQDGAQQYLKFQQEIDQANTKLSSMTAQQERAKQSVELQTSGIIKLNSNIKTREALTTAMIEKQKAMGDAEGASRTKLAGLEEAQTKYGQVLEKEKDLLAKVAKESGDTSEAYLKQKTRVAELETKMASGSNEIKKLNEQLNKKPTGFLSGVSSKLTKVNEKAEKTSGLFRKVLGANLVASGITSALSSITSHFSEVTEAVKQYDDKQQTMKATWDTLTGSAKKGTAMVDVGNKLAAAYNQDINVVDELNQQFYHVFDNQPRTEKLTKSVLTLGDTLNLSAQNTERLGTNFTHMMSSGKMQLGDFNMITDQLPMYGEQLLKYEQKVQKNSKLTMSKLRDEMSAGKISAKDAETVMNSLGDKYQKASENLMKTGPGMVRAISTQTPALLEAFYKPIRNMKNPLIGQVSKWVGDNSTKKEFAGIGENITKQLSRITKAFGGAKKIDIGSMFNKGLGGLNKSITSLGDTIVHNKGHIKDLVGSFKTSAATSVKIFATTLKDLEPILKATGKLAAAHPKAFAAMAASGLVAGKAMKVMTLAMGGLKIISKATKWVKDFSGAQKILNVVMKANPYAVAIAAIVALGAAFVTLYKHNKKFRDFINGIGKAATQFFKSFKKSWDNFWNGIGSWFSKKMSAMSKTFSTFTKGFTKLWNSFSKALSKAWNAYWTNLFNFYKKIFDSIVKFFNSFGKAFMKAWSSLKSSFSKSWSSHWNAIRKFFSDTTNSMYKSFTGWTSAIGKALSNFGGSFKKAWQNISSAVKSIFSGLWKEMKKLAHDGMQAVVDVINKAIGGINGVIHLFGGKATTISPIKFATGTGAPSSSFRRAITQITPAIVNDEPGAPNPELIFRKATGSIEYSRQANAHTLLMPGDEVANATDSAKLAPLLGITHFAGGGIGSFFSGLWNGVSGFVSDVSKKLKELYTTGTKIIADPSKALSSLMTYNNGGAKGFFPTMVKGGFDKTKKQAGDWWNALWSMVSFDGGGFGGVWAKSPGKGWSVTSGFGNRGAVSGGFSQHDGVDFSGANTVHAMHGGTVWRVGGAPSGWGGDNGIGQSVVVKASDGYVIYQELNGKYNSGADILVSKGDTIKTGEAIAKLGSSGTHVHVGLSKSNPFSHSGTSTAGWYDITTMKGSSSETTSDSSGKASSALEKLAKNQVGSGFWKMISKLASLFGEDDDSSGGTSAAPSGSHKNWLKQAGIPESQYGMYTYIINHESGWDPHATNPSSGAYGIPQSLPASKMASAGSDWRSNPITQLKWMKSYVNSAYGGIKGAYDFWKGHHAYANGGLVSNHSLIEVAEHNMPEMVIPLDSMKRSRAWQLIGDVVTKFVGEDPHATQNSSQPNVKDNEELVKLNAKFDTLLTLFGQLLGLNSAQLAAIKDSSFDTQKFYKQQAADLALRSSQAL